MSNLKSNRRLRIKRRIRKNISGTSARPRLSIFRSNKQIYAQLIDDVSGKTLCACSSREKEIITIEGSKKDIASLVGKTLAEKAVKLGVSKVSFDRAGYLYHGRVKSLADGARAGGLQF